MEQLRDSQHLEETIQNHEKVVLKFWAEWCGPCKALSPVMDSVEVECPKTKFIAVNVDDNPDVAQKYGVRGIPTVAFLDKGEVVNTLVGNHPKDTFIEKLTTLGFMDCVAEGKLGAGQEEYENIDDWYAKTQTSGSRVRLIIDDYKDKIRKYEEDARLLDAKIESLRSGLLFYANWANTINGALPESDLEKMEVHFPQDKDKEGITVGGKHAREVLSGLDQSARGTVEELEFLRASNNRLEEARVAHMENTIKLSQAIRYALGVLNSGLPINPGKDTHQILTEALK